jgi:hypothetical protein
MAAENSLRVPRSGMRQGPGCHLAREAQPHGVESLEKSHNSFLTERDLLQKLMTRREEPAQQAIVDQESVKLMTMNCQVANAAVMPLVFLVNLNSNQVRHNLRQSVVVVSFDPDHLDGALGIGEFADVTEELPMLFLKPTKIQIAENITEQY